MHAECTNVRAELLVMVVRCSSGAPLLVWQVMDHQPVHQEPVRPPPPRFAIMLASRSKLLVLDRLMNSGG